LAGHGPGLAGHGPGLAGEKFKIVLSANWRIEQY